MIAQSDQQFTAFILSWRFQRLPEGRFSAKVHLAEGQKHLANRVVSREPVVVEHVQVQNSGLQLLDGESLEVECLVPARVQCAPLNLGLQPVLLVRQ